MTEHHLLASVVIPCRNEVKYIEAVLRALINSTEKNIEVLVVDGMSEDGTREVIKKLALENPSIRIIDNEKKITPVAFNLGIKNARGHFIFIVGARHVLENNYLETCIRILNEDKSIACVGGKVINIFENETSELIAKAMASPFAVGAANFRVKTEDSFVDTVGTPCYRRSLFDEIGFFDETLLRNQDDDFNFRVSKAGYKIMFTVRTSIRYYVRASFKNLFRQFSQYGYWKVFVNRKHKTITTVRQLIPAMFVVYVFAGAAAGFIQYYLWYLWAAGLAFYLLTALFFAAKTNGISGMLKTVYCFMLLHFSYGQGYLKGIFDFLILRKKTPASNKTALTR